MNNQEISALMRSHKDVQNIFVGVYPANLLPETIRKDKPCAYIANTENHVHHGSHWCCFYFPKHSLPEYWDSFGMEPTTSLKSFIGNNYLCSNKMIQHPFSSVCGQHCCFYILKRAQGYDMCDIVSSFSDDLIKNGILVNLVIEKTFSVNLDVISLPFLNKQVSRSMKTFLR